ncbi:MAG: hypothetical protein NT030_02185 [Candidatus Saganbacteria bacterium]|nr:hypothetical protein [Candidatus Saganbacteria bacterium]
MMKSFIPRIECFQKIKTVTKNKLANIKAKIKSSRSLALFGQTFSCEPIYTYIPSVFKTDKVMGLNNIDIPLKTLAQQAGDIMIKVRSNNLMNIKEKEDKSIVTAADSEIQELVDKTLSSLLPNSVVIGEESFSLQTIEKAKGARFVWVVDPLDGTQDYAKGEKAYCIAIILLENGYPVHSLIYAPEFDIDGKGYSLFEASRNKEGAYLNGKPIFVNNNVSS